MKAESVLVALLCSCILGAVVDASPAFWRSCTHPTSGHGRHGYQATADSAIAMKVLLGAKPTTTYCAGTYTVQVNFPTARAYMLTTSVGKLRSTGLCAGKKLISNTKVSSFATKLAIPCSARGTIVVKVTSASSRASAYLHNSITIKRAATCPSCAG